MYFFKKKEKRALLKLMGGSGHLGPPSRSAPGVVVVFLYVLFVVCFSGGLGVCGGVFLLLLLCFFTLLYK